MNSSLFLIIFSTTWIVVPDEIKFTDNNSEIMISNANLQEIIRDSESGDTIFLKKGFYQAIPSPYTEFICGNCENPNTEIHATTGFHIRDKNLTIIGEDRDSVILITNAGYGILFENSYGSKITNVSITGGKRDPEEMATDAGIVGKKCRLTIKDVRIIDNTHLIDTVVVGIGGIFGREGAEIFALNNEIINNGWDGITLYRGATAVIADNVIRKGRGAGIGITWDATALVYRNRISEYWKGIGAFGKSRVICMNNAVYDNRGWGIIATGESYMEVKNNIIYHNGNCGFAVWRETAKGMLKNNIIIENGWKEEWVCPCVGVWLNTKLDNFPIEFNDVWGNREGNYRGITDQTGKNGNISDDPLFIDIKKFILSHDSPCINSGDPFIIDINGSRCDMGIYGGPLGFR